MIDPSDATLSEALDFLTSRWSDLVDGILKGWYAFWVGSGISRGKFPDLRRLIEMLLDRLYQASNNADPACPYRRALRDIANLTSIRGIDFTINPLNWNEHDSLVDQLQSKYADVLDVKVRTSNGVLDLFWDVLELHKLYGDQSIEPDVEHDLLALLVEEGIISKIVTTNWDALIEIAYDNYHEGACMMSVVTCPEEMTNADGTAPTLLKIHGCARRAITNPGHNRPYIVATKTQILMWSEDHSRGPFRDAIRTWLRQYRALFVGLSGQDYNLQAVCTSASLAGNCPAPTRQWVVFTATGIGGDQRAVLNAIYGESGYGAQANEIDEDAALPLYGKPLLGSLYLLTVFRKARIILEKGQSHFFSDPQRQLALDWLNSLERFLRQKYDAVDPRERWRDLIQDVPAVITRFMRLYRSEVSASTTRKYSGIYPRDLSHMENDPNLVLFGFHWMILSIAVLCECSNRGMWTLDVPIANGEESGQITLTMSGNPTKLFILASDIYLGKLIDNGILDPGVPNSTVVIYPHGHHPDKRITSPRRVLPGRRIGNDPIEIWLEDIACENASVDGLLDGLRTSVMEAWGYASN